MEEVIRNRYKARFDSFMAVLVAHRHLFRFAESAGGWEHPNGIVSNWGLFERDGLDPRIRRPVNPVIGDLDTYAEEIYDYIATFTFRGHAHPPVGFAGNMSGDLDRIAAYLNHLCEIQLRRDENLFVSDYVDPAPETVVVEPTQPSESEQIVIDTDNEWVQAVFAKADEDNQFEIIEEVARVRKGAGNGSH